MSFYLQLGAFLLTLLVVLRLLARFPDSRLSRLAYSWYGPAQSDGELRSQYFWRWCRYALAWLAQAVLLFFCGVVALKFYPDLGDSIYFHAIFFFALPILAGMALLGAIIAGLLSWKAKMFGPNPAFSERTRGHAV